MSARVTVYCDVQRSHVRVEQSDDGGITLRCASGEGVSSVTATGQKWSAALTRCHRKGRPQSMKTPPYVAYLVTHNSPNFSESREF